MPKSKQSEKVNTINSCLFRIFFGNNQKSQLIVCLNSKRFIFNYLVFSELCFSLVFGIALAYQ
jgi:hypothetical protein